MTDSSTKIATAHTPEQLVPRPGTFISLLPTVNDLFQQLSSLSNSSSTNTDNNVEASDLVNDKAKELFSSLEKMKSASMDLQGGQYSTSRILELSKMMDVEIEKRRETLRRLSSLDMPTVNDLRKQDLSVEK